MRSVFVLVLLCSLAACSSKDATVQTPPEQTCDGGACGGGCAADTDCKAEERCADGKCVVKQAGCATTAECKSGQACRNGNCVTARCANDGECESGEVCRSGACDFKGCRGDADCPSGRSCGANHVCQECGADSDCPMEKPICRGSDGTCIDCESDLDCGAPKPPFCSKATGTCVHCLVDENCPAGLRCEKNACVGGKVGDTCNETALCSEGLICVNNGTGTVCLQKCNVYSPMCPTTQQCARLGDGAGGLVFELGHPLGVCLTQIGGGKAGDSCTSRSPCAYSLYCVPDAYGAGHCHTVCDPKVMPATCAAGTTCNKIDAGLGTNDKIGVCYVASDWDKPCTNDSGCGTGLGCTVASDPTSFEGWGTRCEYAPPSATKTANQGCAADTDCVSGLCLKSAKGQGTICYGACTTDADCPGGFCDDYTFNVDNGDGTTGMVDIKGCHLGCKSNGACTATNGVCYAAVTTSTPATVRGECGAPYGTGDIGAACTTAADCQAGRCALDARAVGTSGVCTTLCEQDSDCKGGLVCPAAGVAVPVTATTFTVGRLCTGADCVSDADCTAPGLTSCRFQLKPASPKNDYVLRCAPPAGSGAAGAACTADANCASGFCFDPGSGSKICFGACDPAATTTTCPANLTCKADVASITVGGTLRKFAACAP